MKPEIRERIEKIRRGEVPRGYKRTKIGIIPEEWSVHSLGDLFHFEGGYPAVRSELTDEGVCYLHYGDIHASTKNCLDVKKDYQKIPKLKIDVDQLDSRYLLRDGDLVFVDASEDYSGIGKSVVIMNEENVPFISGLHTIIAREKTNRIDRDFKKYFLSLQATRKQFAMYATGVSVLGISRSNIKKIIVSLPQRTEQQKIANILSTWDKAIELKEKLIEQKKRQKKGVVQRLLTGKVRLPGFNGKWGNIKLKEILEVRKEKSEVTSDLELYSLTIEAGITPKTDRYNREFLVKDDHKQYKIVRKNDIVYNPSNLRFGAIAVSKIEKPVLVSPIYEVLRIKDHASYDIEFIEKILTWDRQIKIFSRKAEGTLVERTAVKIDDFLNTDIFIPLDVKEQTAIAEVLNNWDKEIQLLVQELEALKQQKKGLIQLLLTGIVRVRSIGHVQEPV